jgi:hypothetical protein
MILPCTSVHHQIFGFHRFVRDAAGLNNQQGTFAGNTAAVAKGIQNQSATNQLQIRFKNFFAQFGEKHQSLAEVMELCCAGAERGDAMRMDSFCQCTRGDAFFGRDSQ